MLYYNPCNIRVNIKVFKIKVKSYITFYDGEFLSIPSVLIPGLYLRLRERQSVSDIAAIRHAEIFLTTKFSLEVSQLSMGKSGSSSSWFSIGRRCIISGHSARLCRRGRRTWRRRMRRWRTS